MFTGIVEGMGEVLENGGGALSLRAGIRGLRLGGSLSVNGACLTLARQSKRALVFEMSRETLERTNLGRLGTGDKVNLERPLAAGEPLGGHIVTGHVDATVPLLEREEQPGGFARLRFGLPRELAGFVAVKGSVTVDGVSLTVTRAAPRFFESVLIPHTLERTTLGNRRPGEPVNLEVDVLARYVRRAMECR